MPIVSTGLERPVGQEVSCFLRVHADSLLGGFAEYPQPPDTLYRLYPFDNGHTCAKATEAPA